MASLRQRNAGWEMNVRRGLVILAFLSRHAFGHELGGPLSRLTATQTRNRYVSNAAEFASLA